MAEQADFDASAVPDIDIFNAKGEEDPALLRTLIGYPHHCAATRPARQTGRLEDAAAMDLCAAAALAD